jgi:hypothetical protein
MNPEGVPTTHNFTHGLTNSKLENSETVKLGLLLLFASFAAFLCALCG